MGKFTSSKILKGSLFRGALGAKPEPSWPVNGNGRFPLPPPRDAITEFIIQNMKRQFLLKNHLDSEFAPTLRVEAPRDDKLFKIRRVGR
jgi:hypothetical protein